MACPSTNSEEQDLFAKLLKKRFDRQPCCAGILYECMRFLIGHYKVKAAEEFLSFGCVRTEHRLVSAYIDRIINVAWCFGHGILLDPETSILCPFQPVPQGGNCEITLRRGRSCLGWKKRAQYLRADLPVLVRLWALFGRGVRDARCPFLGCRADVMQKGGTARK
jgi:hypothetical protein